MRVVNRRAFTPAALVAAAAASALAPALAHAQCDPGGIPTPAPASVSRFSGFATLGNDVVGVGSFGQVIGQSFGIHVLRWNPGEGIWRPLTAGVGGPADGEAFAAAVLPNGDLVAGGTFTAIYGAGGAGNIINTRAIARWNAATATWTNFGAGMGSPQSASASVNALLALPGGDVVVGGEFVSGNGTSASNIARLNPTTGAFTALGQGVSGGSVSALARLSGGDIIVGGDFTQAGGSTSAARLARLNPSTNAWSAFGAPIGGPVNALLVLDNGDVVAGGGFTNIGGVAASRLARWSAATGTWSAIGSGLNGPVASLGLMPDGDLLVGGSFDASGSTIVRFAGRYDFGAGTWTNLNADSSVNALAVLPTGEVLAGGSFSLLGNAPANRVGRYSFTKAPSFTTQPAPQSVSGGALAVFTAVPTSGYDIASAQWQLETAPNSGVYASLSTGPIAGSGATAVVSLPGPLPVAPGPTTLTIVGADNALNNRRVRVTITGTCAAATTVPALLNATGITPGGGGCYPNCDGSTTVPQLNALDFSCFLARYRAGCN